MNVLLALLLVTFPAENARLPHVAETYFMGACAEGDPAAPLLVNGQTTAVWRTGAFVTMVPVTSGVNVVEVEWGTNRLVRTFAVARPPKATAPSNGRPKPEKPRDVYEDLKIARDTPPRPSPVGRKPGDLFILVDPGHGGDDSGALTPRGWKEKDANLLVAAEIVDYLRAVGFKAELTRAADVTTALYERPRMACRRQADAFVSVHHNSTAVDRDPRARRHVCTYASTTNSLPLARAIQRHLAAAVAPVPDSGAQIRSLAVCRNPIVPSCLVEVDFINLPEGEEASWQVERRRRVARAVASGILDWMHPSRPESR